MMKYLIPGFLLLCSLSDTARAQKNTPAYPQKYFRNPLNIPILLAGNFGECRPGHFHSGLDIKTQARENLPVHAAADGFISRIKMEKGGFGHALYLTHPNGYTTVYAHLNDFVPAVQKYLRQQQYLKESWEVDLALTPVQFPVKKGEQIAWSGNTGGSTAPHLHFEIRDSETEHPLNPQLFGFEIVDNTPPIPLKLAVYNAPLTQIYHLPPQLFPLKKKGSDYYPAVGDTLVLNGLMGVGIGLEVNDFMEGSSNTLAVYTASLYINDMLQSRVRLDNIGYAETRYLHAYADYKTKQDKGIWLQCLFRLPGNQLSHIYDTLRGQEGVFTPDTQKLQTLKIILEDGAGNESVIRCMMRVANRTADTAMPCGQLFRAGQINRTETADISFTLDADALYTDLCFQLDRKPDAQSYSQRFQVHRSSVPVHRFFDLNIKPNRPIPFTLQDKIVLIYHDGRNETGKSAVKDSYGWYRAAVRAFGTYRLVADTTAPRIVAQQAKGAVLTTARELRFMVTDNLTSVKKFRAELDGKWLLFEQSGHGFFYKFDAHCPKGKHMLKITASDENGNTSVLNFPFTR